jgi:hypothetical protein
MSEVDEAFGIMINIGKQTAQVPVEIILTLLNFLKNKAKENGLGLRSQGHDRTGIVQRVKNIIPHLGEKGNVSMSKLQDISGDGGVVPCRVEGEQFHKMCKALRQCGVPYSFSKNADGSYFFAVSGKNAEMLNSALCKVALAMGATEQEVLDAQKNDILQDAPMDLDTVDLKRALPSVNLDERITHMGVEWNINEDESRDRGVFVYEGQLKQFDLKADSMGNYSVSCQGKEIKTGNKVENGIHSAMQGARREAYRELNKKEMQMDKNLVPVKSPSQNKNLKKTKEGQKLSKVQEMNKAKQVASDLSKKQSQQKVQKKTNKVKR